MTPSSAQTLHRHWIGAGGSRRTMVFRSGRGRRAGRCRHGSALIHGSPAPPTVAARTMLPRCCARRRAGPGTSSGKSRKWCRSLTNIPQDCTDRGSPTLSRTNLSWRLRSKMSVTVTPNTPLTAEDSAVKTPKDHGSSCASTLGNGSVARDGRLVGIVPLWERRPNAGRRGMPWPAITRRGWVSSSNTLRSRSTVIVPARSTPTPSTRRSTTNIGQPVSCGNSAGPVVGHTSR